MAIGIKEISVAMGKGNVCFGIRQALKNSKKLKSVFIAKDTRDETIERLEKNNIEFVVLRSKADICKELNLDFESEVISIISPASKKKKSKSK